MFIEPITLIPLLTVCAYFCAVVTGLTQTIIPSKPLHPIFYYFDSLQKVITDPYSIYYHTSHTNLSPSHSLSYFAFLHSTNHLGIKLMF